MSVNVAALSSVTGYARARAYMCSASGRAELRGARIWILHGTDCSAFSGRRPNEL